MDPRGRPKIALDADAFFILDAGRAAGPIAMMDAVARRDRARQGARRLRSASCATRPMRRAIGRYAHWVVERGCACIILAAAYPFMPYHGARKASLPTAPVVMGMPTERHGAVVLDMASSIVAMGKILTARAKGEQLEDGWALDAEGKPTTDPQEGRHAAAARRSERLGPRR